VRPFLVPKIEKLRTKFAFFRIARANQHKARWMLDGNAFTLDLIDSGNGHVEQQIDEMIFEQVYLVDVEKASISTRQQAGIEDFSASRKGALNINRSTNAILSRSQR